MSTHAASETSQNLRAGAAYRCTTASGRKLVVCVAPGAAGRQALKEIRRAGRDVEIMTHGEALSTARLS